MDTKTDIELILKAKQGNAEALSDLYRKYVDSVYKFVYYRVGKKEEAEDLTHETFIKMMKSLKRFAFDSQFKTWLLGIAKHTILDYFRKYYKNRTLPLEDFLNVDLGTIEEPEVNTKPKEKKVASILRRLPKNYRDVLELRFLRGYSLRETAAALNKTISNIKVLQYRALHKAQQFGPR